MKHTFYILYRIHFIFIFLITYLFLLSCQEKKKIEPGKPDDIAFTKTDSANSSGKKKIQEMKADQKIYPNKGNNNVRHSTNNGCRKITEQEKSAYHTPEPVSYPSGEIALEHFLETNNLYNSTKYYESIDGIAYLKLLIDTTGKVIGKNIVRGIGLGIDEEALRLASLLEFNPAKDLTGNVMLSV